MLDRLGKYRPRWKKYTVQPKYREQSYLIAEKEPRSRRVGGVKVVWRNELGSKIGETRDVEKMGGVKGKVLARYPGVMINGRRFRKFSRKGGQENVENVSVSTLPIHEQLPTPTSFENSSRGPASLNSPS